MGPSPEMLYAMNLLSTYLGGSVRPPSRGRGRFVLLLGYLFLGSMLRAPISERRDLWRRTAEHDLGLARAQSGISSPTPTSSSSHSSSKAKRRSAKVAKAADKSSHG